MQTNRFKFRFVKVQFKNGMWRSYFNLDEKKFNELKKLDYYAIYVSISRFRNPQLVDRYYNSVEERVNKSGFLNSDIWVEVDADDVGSMKNAFAEIKRMKKYLDKKPELKFENAICSGGGYYLNYRIKSSEIPDIFERFKYFLIYKTNMINDLLSRGFHPCHHYNPDGSLNSAMCNPWGVRRVIPSDNVKRSMLSTRIHPENHTVPRQRNKGVSQCRADDRVFPSTKLQKPTHPDERSGVASLKILSNVINRHEAFPVFKFDSFNIIDLAKIQQEYDLGDFEIHKRGNQWICYSLTRLPKERLAKIYKRFGVMEWLKFNNIYFSISDELMVNGSISCKHICTLVRKSTRYKSLNKVKRKPILGIRGINKKMRKND
jgi:hypothetical protein